MNEGSPHRVIWPHELLARYKLDADTKLFLSTVGLPEFIPGMTIEFGVFDSDGPDLIIGEDYGLPIYIDSTSGAVFEARESTAERCFINSSARLLSRFIQMIVFDAPHDSGSWAEQVREQLLALDLAALDDSSHCLWPFIIDRFEINLS